MVSGFMNPSKHITNTSSSSMCKKSHTAHEPVPDGLFFHLDDHTVMTPRQQPTCSWTRPSPERPRRAVPNRGGGPALAGRCLAATGSNRGKMVDVAMGPQLQVAAVMGVVVLAAIFERAPVMILGLRPKGRNCC